MDHDCFVGVKAYNCITKRSKWVLWIQSRARMQTVAAPHLKMKGRSFAAFIISEYHSIAMSSLGLRGRPPE
jgi:hypothetical protein